jgi:hypothetical protein
VPYGSRTTATARSTGSLRPGIFVAEPVGDEVWVLDYGGQEIYRIDPSAIR